MLPPLGLIGPWEISQLAPPQIGMGGGQSRAGLAGVVGDRRVEASSSWPAKGRGCWQLFKHTKDHKQN